MTTQSPFPWLESLLEKLPVPAQPPAWLVDEGQRRVVLLLNHVLQQEPQAMDRLVRQKGRVVLAQWRSFTFRLLITPAGLLDVAHAAAQPDLTLQLTQDSPWDVAQTLAQGNKPAVRIEGDVQLAAELNWLADHMRWDLEEDLSRVVGDVAAHSLCQAARTVQAMLQQFVAQRRASSGSSGSVV